MKCEIIKDLLPLYHDDVVSNESRELIDEHLKTCEDCRKYLDGISTELTTKKQVKTAQPLADSLRKIKQKLWRKNVMIAAVSVICSIAVLFGVFAYATVYDTYIPYSGEVIKLQPSTMDYVDENGVKYQRPSVKVQYWGKDLYGTYGGGVDVEVDGKTVCVQTVYFTSTLWARTVQRDWLGKPIPWQWDCDFSPESDQMEIYYMNSANHDDMGEIFMEEGTYESKIQKFYAACKANGTLIWSGANPDK